MTTNEFEKYPIVRMGGDDNWVGGWEMGEVLDRRFPNQDAHDFCIAVEYNGSPLTEAHEITGLVMLQQGENDRESWIWEVTFANGQKWHAEGGCDYTGWDCQSSLDWIQLV